MAHRQRQSVRKPATKFAHLQKKMQQAKRSVTKLSVTRQKQKQK